jgi:hypothetical protein
MMKSKYKLLSMAIIFLLLAISVIFVLFGSNLNEGGNVGFGIDADSLVTIATGILAAILLVISVIAYKEDKRKRLLFVTGAFLLFAIKGFLLVSDMFFPQGAWVDPASHMLDFIILLFFFLGLIKK